MAKRQKRPCYLISFSVRSKSIDLAKPRNWGKIDDFLEHTQLGVAVGRTGTDGEQMLAEAIRILQKGTYEMADVLIVSDFEFPLPNPSTMEKIDKEKTLGARFYGLKIGHYGVKDYKLIMDKIWEV